MKKLSGICLCGLAVIFLFAGCTVRTYRATHDRIDQGLSEGNRGYLKGSAPLGETRERKTTRSTFVVETEIGRPKKVKKVPVTGMKEEFLPLTSSSSVSQETAFEQYKVQKGDTLQKISQKFYGTTKKWSKIYEANRDTLKGPDKVYPGQTLNIPVEGLKETKENLK